MRNKLFSRAFTIVELLVVIVIIGILATVVITAFNGISGRAKDAALSSDLTQAKKQIEAFSAINGKYPSANNCTNTLTTEICLKTSPGNTLTYTFIGNTASPPYTLTGAVATQTDPYVSSVVALLHGDGSNGSTTFTDSSPLAANWTGGSSLVISNTQSKFGGTSIKGANSNSQLVPSAASSNFSFGTGDFTIEAWYNTSNPWGANYIFDYNNDGTASKPALILDFGVLRYWVNGTYVIESPTVVVGTWNHIAISRSNGQTRMFLNGTQVGSTYSGSDNIIAPTSRPLLSSAGAAGYVGSYGWDGYLDEIRITKGVARYTSPFTPPTAAF